MTTIIEPNQPDLTEPDSAERQAAGPGYRPASFLNVLRSEWTKARTVPSTLLSLGIAVGLVIGLGVLVSALSAHEYELGTKGVRASWDPTSISVAGLSLGQLAIGVLGVILIASEYSTGSIRASLAAVPRRARLLASKGLVLVGGTLVIIEATVFVAFFLGQLMMSGHAPTASLGQPDVVRALVGSALYTALFGLLGLALGAIVRSAAGAIAILVGIVFVVPLISLALPSSIQDNLNKYWPTEAGQQVSSVVRTAHTLSPWAGFALMCGFVGVVLLAAFFTMGRRDA